jgi:hypothetical protein
VPGWRKAKIYPDFIFARITVLEAKNDQLGNLDIAYKREALSFSVSIGVGTGPSIGVQKGPL